MRLMQHKKEAFWFYRFLSIFYDKLVNPLFWTKKMRDESLTIAQLDQPNIQVIDVGSGTGFTTEGIVKHVSPTQVTCVDQSPKQKSNLPCKVVLSKSEMLKIFLSRRINLTAMFLPEVSSTGPILKKESRKLIE